MDWKNMLDWKRFLEDQRVEYVTAGLNVKRGNIGIKCPMCGDEDPSQHMGINLSNGYWGCWRSGDHAGRKPHRLIQALLGCSYAQSALVVAQYSRSDPTGLEECLAMLEPTSEAPTADTGPEVFTHLPEEFKLITRHNTRAYSYLFNRGFKDIHDLVQAYDLRYCQTGRWKLRIIIPVRHGGELIGWTARRVVMQANAPRYLESSPALKSTVFNEQCLKKGGEILFITEGPFDALKLDAVGRFHHARAVCTFGVRLSLGQAALLNAYSGRFTKVRLLYDSDAISNAHENAKWLTGKNVKVQHFNYGQAKDAGDLSWAETIRFITSCL